eukprot:5284261-Amphidinium_carterae.1
MKSKKFQEQRHTPKDWKIEHNGVYLWVFALFQNFCCVLNSIGMQHSEVNGCGAYTQRYGPKQSNNDKSPEKMPKPKA